MKFAPLPWLCGLWLVTSALPPALAQPACSSRVLSRFQRYSIAAGDTIESIAQRYGLLPTTLILLNPSLRGGTAPVGEEILIPPFNGVRIEVPQGVSWNDLETAYGVRADVLFEINGCQKEPTVVFIPGVNWQRQRSDRNSYTGLSSYPLAQTSPIAVAYGWAINPQTQQRWFHSGIDLLAASGTPVVAAEDGTVVFATAHESYGNLAVINHPGGQQTRYAHLESLQVRVGQQVTAGETIGTVGATGRPDISESHLHFEVRFNTPQGWIAQDPQLHLARP